MSSDEKIVYLYTKSNPDEEFTIPDGVTTIYNFAVLNATYLKILNSQYRFFQSETAVKILHIFFHKKFLWHNLSQNGGYFALGNKKYNH